MRLYFIFFVVFLFVGCDEKQNYPKTNQMTANKTTANSSNANSAKPASGSVPVYTYEVVNTFKHDSKAFTQGLIFHDGFLYESTGEYGDSTLRKVELESGKPVRKIDLEDDYFAEGMTLLNGKIYQITWQEQTAFAYNLDDFKLLKKFEYSGDGWGLANDGKNLIMSDGTHVIRFLDPETFQTVRTITTFREDGKPLMDINELEYVKGEIWANIWRASEPFILGKPNHIARIDPNSGKLVGWIDLANISPEDVQRDPSSNTLNGIAFDAASERIFVTGKNWKKLFEIRVKPKQ